MWVRNTRDLGLLIKDRRRRMHMSQAALAKRIGASRHWVMDIEAGKKTAEVGLVLDALAALELTCSLQPRFGTASEDSMSASVGSASSANLPSVDFGAILASARASGRD